MSLVNLFLNDCYLLHKRLWHPDLFLVDQLELDSAKIKADDLAGEGEKTSVLLLHKRIVPLTPYHYHFFNTVQKIVKWVCSCFKEMPPESCEEEPVPKSFLLKEFAGKIEGELWKSSEGITYTLIGTSPLSFEDHFKIISARQKEKIKPKKEEPKPLVKQKAEELAKLQEEEELYGDLLEEHERKGQALLDEEMQAWEKEKRELEVQALLRRCHVAKAERALIRQLDLNKVARKTALEEDFKKFAVQIIDPKESGKDFLSMKESIDQFASSGSLSNDLCEYLQDRKTQIEAIFLAMLGEQIIGYVVTSKLNKFTLRRFKKEEDYEDFVQGSEIEPIIVDSALRRRGVGTKLLVAAIKKAKTLGKKLLVVDHMTTKKEDGHPIKGGIKPEAIENEGFFTHFNTKFGIPVRHLNWSNPNVTSVYNLEEVDIEQIVC